MLYKDILKKFRKNKVCPFCKVNKKFVILENNFCYLTPARAPYVKNHLLIVPRRHVLQLDKLKGKEKKAIFDLIMKGTEILEKKYPAVELSYKEGELIPAGKSIPHLHFHLVPKRKRSSLPKSSRKFLSEKDLIKKVEELKKF